MDHFIKIFETTSDDVQIDLIQKEYNEMHYLASSVFEDGITIDDSKYPYPTTLVIPPGSFLFRPSPEFINLLERLSVPKEINFFYNSILDTISRDSFDQSIVEFSRPVVNDWNLLDLNFKFQRVTIDEVKEYLSEMRVSSNYIIEQVVYLNDFAKEEYKEVYFPSISTVGKKLLGGN